ncbi:hypothetical protein DICPUDRAFT_79382 [Dictyostelium purpureum]|uniref:Chitin-binding type-4 domain-containing protein n=1 Tax=Dictyostelium purpureum TaxID=5786 RepID=F0ZME9_DICPU|nr:uncharacterized protein DICPUDRAFT_79382 [Dictyostelium purpureum]EGC34904.1 hypothetical protein DICPUDRAFT_79382 [Dictyostelium purpureum]|eukprot:XP_003288596.1 hypothetical protein DICPUDRAFT_79382 [Dictyostelium purpureum]
MKLIIIFFLLFFSFSVNSNGFTSYPPSRQLVCNRNPINNIWVDEIGSGIIDPHCKAAYGHVFEKFNNSKDGANAARLQFIKSDEMKVFIPYYKKGFEELKKKVPEHLCCAANMDKYSALGNKKGFTIRYNWPATEFQYDLKTNTTIIPFEFCATKLPEKNVSSYWEFYLSKDYDKEIDKMKWEDMELVAKHYNIKPSVNTNPFCTSSNVYKMNIKVPSRKERSTVLLVRWQLETPDGECIINCSDIKFKNQIRIKKT